MKNEFEEFVEDLVDEIMDEIYFDDINETVYTLEDYEVCSPMYDIKRQELLKIFKARFADKTVISGKPMN